MIEKLHALIDDIHVVMMTTRRGDGRLVTRPMATQGPDSACDLWFLASEDAEVVRELEADAHVSLAYVSGDAWISVSGTARLVREGWVRIEIEVESAEHFDGVTTTALEELPVLAGGIFGRLPLDDNEQPPYLA